MIHRRRPWTSLAGNNEFHRLELPQIGSAVRVRALKDLVSSHKPVIVGLSETKLSSKKWDSLRVYLGFQNCFSTSCIGKSGGLALLWSTEVDVTVRSFSRSHTDLNVEVQGESAFRLTGRLHQSLTFCQEWLSSSLQIMQSERRIEGVRGEVRGSITYFLQMIA